MERKKIIYVCGRTRSIACSILDSFRREFNQYIKYDTRKEIILINDICIRPSSHSNEHFGEHFLKVIDATHFMELCYRQECENLKQRLQFSGKIIEDAIKKVKVVKEYRFDLIGRKELLKILNRYTE